LVDELDGCVGEDPEGEAGDGEGDGFALGGHSYGVRNAEGFDKVA
jgi:hypothetical protein